MHGQNTVQPVLPPAGAAIPRPPVQRLLGVQAGLGALVAVTASWQAGPVAAASALVGLGVALLPNLVFVALAFRHRGARAAQRAVADLYVAEAWKFGLTVVLFGAVFSLMRPLAAGWLFAGYIAALAAYWLSPWLFVGRTRVNG